MARDMAVLVADAFQEPDAARDSGDIDHALTPQAPSPAAPCPAPMRLKISISIEIEAADFVEAAAHQRRLQEYLERAQATYPEMDLHFWERRRRLRSKTPDALRGIRSYTGRLSRYRSE
jgi:hypothetical protein